LTIWFFLKEKAMNRIGKKGMDLGAWGSLGGVHTANSL